MRRRSRKFLGIEGLTKSSRKQHRRQNRRPAPPRPPPARKAAVAPKLKRQIAQALRARHHRFVKAPAPDVGKEAAPVRGRAGRSSVRSSPTVSWKGAARTVATNPAPVPVRGLSVVSPPTERRGRGSQGLIRQTKTVLKKAEAEATRRFIHPTRPLRSSRMQLWRWYRANGWSWQRFVAEHGEPT